MGLALAGVLAAAVAMATIACGGETSIAVGKTSEAPRPAPSDDGGSGGDGVSPRSGTRLQLREPYAYDFPRLWDSNKNVDCGPLLALDGTERCLPNQVSRVYFTDADCTHAVISQGSNDCGAPDVYYVDAGGPAGCLVPKVAVYTAGEPLDAPKELFLHNVGFCTSTGALTVPPTGPFFAAVPSDPKDWVEFTEEVTPATDALAVVSWIGPDGSRVPNALRLLPSGVSCDRYPRPPNPQPPEIHCIPTPRAERVSGYADDQCAGKSLAISCAATDIIDLDTGSTDGLFETGAIASSVYYHKIGDGRPCVPWPPLTPGGRDATFFYSFGPPLSMDRYPVLTDARTGSDRIQTVFLRSAGKNLLAEYLYDTTLDAPCLPVTLSSGGTWCVSGQVDFRPEYALFFTDSLCTHRVELVSGPSFVPEPRVRFALVYPPGQYCDAKLLPTLHSVVERSGPIFQLTDGATCAPQSFPDTRIFEPGEALDPSQALAAVPAL